MTTSEFFSYLLDRDASHKLAVELADICRARSAQRQEHAIPNLVTRQPRLVDTISAS